MQPLLCIVVVQPLSRVWLLVTPWTALRQASLSFTTSSSFFQITIRHVRSRVSLPLWFSRFILSGVVSSCLLLFPSSILDTFRPGGLIFRCLVLFVRSHSQNTGEVRVPSSSGHHYPAPSLGTGSTQDPLVVPAHWQPAIKDPPLVVLCRSGSRPLTSPVSGGDSDYGGVVVLSWRGVRAGPAFSLRPPSSPDCCCCRVIGPHRVWGAGTYVFGSSISFNFFICVLQINVWGIGWEFSCTSHIFAWKIP